MIKSVYDDTVRALRQIARAPAFPAAVVVILAFTVGANTAVISLLNAVALRPLPIRAPERLVVLTPTDDGGRQSRPIHHDDAAELAKHPVFETLGLYTGGGVLWIEARGVTGEGGIEAVTPGFHEALGLRPLLGRFFDSTDGAGGGTANPVTVISHRFWQRYYGSDLTAIGDRLLINAIPFTIVGVTPPDYTGLYVESGVDFSVPSGVLGRQLPTNQFPAVPGRPLRGSNAVGYLRPGVSLEQARAAIETAWRSLRSTALSTGLSPAEQADLRTQRIKVESLSSGFSNIAIRHRDLLNALAAGTAVLLAIACVNLTGLLLARVAARDHEIFVRLSLGATGGNLARQLVIEGLVLSAIGTAAGVVVAWWASQGLTLLLWQGVTSLILPVTPDGRVLALTALMSIVITLLIGALPAWNVHRRARPSTTRTVTPSAGRWSKALLVAQVALSLVLLFTAGLFASSLSSLRGLDSGVRAEGIRWTRLLPRPGGYRAVDETTYYPHVLERLAAVPGIDAVAFSHHYPAFFNFGNLVSEYAIARAGAASDAGAVTGMMEFVSPGFFETLEIPLLQGRDVTWDDDLQSPAVAVVNETLSKRLFPDGTALGQRIRIGDDAVRAAVEIIGIVPDATMGAYRATHQPVAFRPKTQEPRFVRSPIAIFRTRLPAESIDPAIAKVVSDAGREYVRRMYSLEEQVDLALHRERLMAWVSSTFAGLSALAACVGLFSLLAYSVARRTREIGVRMALGASRAAIVAMVLREALVVTLLGVGIGIPVALAAGRLSASMVFGVSSLDPMILGGSILLFTLVSMIAGAWPAVRASNVPPTTALRCD